MRFKITTGEFAGQTLTVNVPKTTRPTSEKLKYSVAQSILNCGGTIMVDLCSGTGAIGLEALSQGFQQVHFVDSNRKCLESVKRLVKELKKHDNAHFHAMDASTFLQKNLLPSIDILYFDPPYAENKLKENVLSLLSTHESVKDCTIFVENGKHHPIDSEWLKPFTIKKEKRFGDTILYQLVL